MIQLLVLQFNAAYSLISIVWADVRIEYSKCYRYVTYCVMRADELYAYETLGDVDELEAHAEQREEQEEDAQATEDHPCKNKQWHIG